MLHEIKNLVAHIRAAYPTEPADGIITISLRDSGGHLWHVTIDGVPPMDVVSILRNGEMQLETRNWAAVEVERLTSPQAFIDSPENIEHRQQQLQHYDDRNGPGVTKKDT